MAQVNVHEAKTQLSKLLARVEAGEEVAVKVRQRVRGGDSVYLLLEEE